ncbi:MAG: 5-oxoprolinase subunit PxpB [Pseudorhodobacter sp.]
MTALPLGTIDAATLTWADLRFSLIGCSALLMEATTPFDTRLQHRILALAEQVRDWDEVAEPVPGVGNLMLVFANPRMVDPARLCDRIARLWPDIAPAPPSGRVIEVPVIYGGPMASDLAAVCAHTGFGPEELARRHAAPDYIVATIASAPGFGYLIGMDPQIATPRKKVPSLNMPKGAVTIGGAQSGISVSKGPNGWNAIGHTDLITFDPHAARPVTLCPGDVVRFRIEEIRP